MAIAWIRQGQSGHEGCISCYERVRGGFLHEFPSAFQLIPSQVKAVGEETGNPFFVNFLRPLWLVEFRDSEIEKKAAQFGRVEDVGIEQRSQRGHGSDADFLVVGGKRGQRGSALGVEFAFVSHETLGADAAMGSHFSMR